MALLDMWQPVQRRERGARIQAPRFDAPNTEALSALRGRAGTLQQTITDPLSAPGIGGTIGALNTQLARQAQAARGQAMGRANNTGQSGFAGAMASAGANIEGQLGDARYQGQSQLISDVLKRAQEELASNLGTRGQFETQLNAQQLDRARILADVANQNAQLDKDYWAGEQAADLEDARRRFEYNRLEQEARNAEADRQARLQETAAERAARLREFDLTRTDRTREFDTTRTDRTREFGLTREDLLDARRQEQERYTTTRMDQGQLRREELLERNRLLQEQRDNERQADAYRMVTYNDRVRAESERRNAEARARAAEQRRQADPVEYIYGQAGIPREPLPRGGFVSNRRGSNRMTAPRDY